MLFMVFMVIGFLGGVVYLIYLPFKIWLLRSGKLSDKLNQRTNWTYILILCLISILIYMFRDYGRTSSKDRLEKIAKIKLPKNFKVIKDEYQDMLQDYCIQYEVQFNKEGTKELIQTIKSSPFYNTKSYHKGAWEISDFITVDSVKAVWAKSPKGYDFANSIGRESYDITLDSSSNKLSYRECAD